MQPAVCVHHAVLRDSACHQAYHRQSRDRKGTGDRHSPPPPCGLQVLQKLDALSGRAPGKDRGQQLSSVDDRHIQGLTAESDLSRSRDGTHASSLSLQPSKSAPTAEEHTAATLKTGHDSEQQPGIQELGILLDSLVSLRYPGGYLRDQDIAASSNP